MDKYIGQFRVDIERDNDGKPMEFTYIRGSQPFGKCKIYRYDNARLRIYAENGHFLAQKIAENGLNATLVIDCSIESVFEFSEADFPLFAALIKCRTKGANIKSKSVRNLPKELRKKKKEGSVCVEVA